MCLSHGLAFSFDHKSPMKIQDIIDLLEEQLPLNLQESWDSSGLQVGSRELECTGVLTTLDITEAIIEEAIQKGCNLIIAHHPVLFKPLKQICGKSYIERCIQTAIKHDISIYAAHTNADSAYMGLNYLLGEKLGLQNMNTLSPISSSSKDGLGVIGDLQDSLSQDAFLQLIAERFNSKQVRHNKLPKEMIKSVAICGGAGAFLWEQARTLGADVLITGEAKYNDYFDAEGIGLITVGHYESEIFAIELFDRIISTRYPHLVRTSEINHNPVITLQ